MDLYMEVNAFLSIHHITASHRALTTRTVTNVAMMIGGAKLFLDDTF